MKKLIILISLSLISTPLMAGSIQLLNYNGDSWVVGTASGDGTFKINYELDNLPDSFTVINPTRNEKAWRWTGSGVEYDTTGVTVQPKPSEAIGQITDYFIDVEGDTSGGLNRVDDLLSTYPTADRAIDNNNYSIAKNRIEKASSDGNLSGTEAIDLKAILDGTY